MNPLRSLKSWMQNRSGLPAGVHARSLTAGMGAFLPPPVMSGVAVTPETALTFSAYFAGINRLSTDVASLPLEVFRSRGNTRTRRPNDPRNDLVYCEPNEDTTSIRYRTAQMSHVVSWGNSFSEIVRFGNGTPAAFHLLSPRPNDTRPARSRSGKLFFETEGGRGPTLPAENVLHVAGLGWDGMLGYSVVAFGRQAIGLGIAAEQYGASWFGNGSIPKGVLKKKTKMTKEAMERLRDQWERIHQGTVNANRVAILEEDLQWEQISIPPEDAQFLSTRQFQVLEIARLLNMPPHKLGDYSHAHLANLEESNLDYLTSTLRPWLEAIEQEYNRKLFTTSERRRGLHVRHDMTALMRGNMAARTARNQAMRNGGALSSDDWRMDEGMNPLPDGQGGKLYVMQGQYVPLSTIADQAEKNEPGPAPNAEPTPPGTEGEPAPVPASDSGETDQ